MIRRAFSSLPGGGSNLLLGLALALVGVSSTHAGSWTTFMGHDTVAVPPKLSVAEADSYFIAVQADIYGVTRADTTVDDTTYTILTVPEYGYTTEIGKPMVPVVTALVAVPDSVEIDFSLAAYDFTTIEDILIYPVPAESIPPDTCDTCYCFEVFTKDSATYATDAFYPGTLAELGTVSHFRSQRVAEIKMYPIQFNPVDSVVKTYHYFRPELTLTGDPVENEVGLGPFEEIGRRCLLNYKGDSSFVSDTTGEVRILRTLMSSQNLADYLIIIADSLWGHGERDSLAYWRKRHNYFDVGVVKLRKIMKEFCPAETLTSTVPSDTCIKSFLQYAYDNYYAPQMPDSHPGYVLIVGDVWRPDSVVLMPSHYAYTPGGDTFATDVWYSCLDGEGDIYPEFAIGRFSVQTTTELDTVASKTCDFEKTPDTTHWRREVLVACPDSLHILAREMTEIFSPSGYDIFLVLNDLGEDWDSTLIEYLDEGKLVAAHVDHEVCSFWEGPEEESFWHDDAAALENGLKLPLVHGCGCEGGRFDKPSHDCIGEAFLKNDDGGAIAYIGASKTGAPGGRIGIAKKTARAVMDGQQWIIGNAIQEARLKLWNDMAGNLLGDPVVDLGDYTAFPDMPDLVVRPCHITLLDREYPSFEDTLTIQTRIFNIGSGDADDVVVMAVDTLQQPWDTIGVDTITSLDARRDTVLEFAWITPDTSYDFGYHDIVVWVDPDSTIDESWEGNNANSIKERIFFYPNEDGWPQKTGGAIRSSPALVDLYDDSKLEIVIGSDDHCLYVFPASGDLDDGWVDTTCAPVWASPAAGDINNDGVPEVIVAADNSLYVWDTAGVLLTDWPIALCDTTRCVYTAALADVDGDDTLDIVVPADSSIHIVRYDTSSVSGWPAVVGSQVITLRSPATADIDGDNDLELFISVNGLKNTEKYSYVYACDDTGAALPGWPPDTICSFGQICLSPALANLDGSGDWEIMTGLGDSMFVWDDAGNRVSPWPVAAPPTRVSSSPAVGDLYTVSSGYEIIAGCAADSVGQGRIYAWESDGDVIESAQQWWPRWTEGGVRSSPALANIDSSSSSPDTLLEVIVGSDGGHVYAIDLYGDDEPNFPFPMRASVISSPAIADVDGDGHLELIVGCQDGYVFVWFLEGSDCASYAAPWPMFKHDYQRTAWMDHTP
jgi:hypothetical protein